MKTITFFNSKSGVGKTSLVYHLAWMYAELGLSVIAADLDPQANLTSMFIDEDQLATLWPESSHTKTIFGAIQPLLEGTGDISSPYVDHIANRIGLLVGDLALSASEDELTSQWPDCLDRKPRAFRVLSAIWRVIEQAAKDRDASLVLIDVGPNLGAVNRAALSPPSTSSSRWLPTFTRSKACGISGQPCVAGARNGPSGGYEILSRVFQFRQAR